MHEYSLVSALLERVIESATAHGASAVRRIELRVGQLAGVEADLLGWAFEVARENTLCHDAELALTEVPARWECPDDGTVITAGEALRCPTCGAPGKLVAGGELWLERIELDVPD